MTVPHHERLVPCPAGLTQASSDEELLAWVKQHYFTQEELAEAGRLGQEQGYEMAIAYLVRVGQETLRHSGEAEPPHLFLTIPTGDVLVKRPGTPVGLFKRAVELSIGALARLILPASLLPLPDEHAARNGMVSVWEGFEEADGEPLPTLSPLPPMERAVRARRVPAKARRLRYDERPVRVGSGKYWRTTQGWVIRDRGLAYALEALSRTGGYEVSIIHFGSNRALASFRVSCANELVHMRVQQLIELIVPLTDWTQGIKAILNEKQGRYKQSQWTLQIEAVWQQLEREALFPLCDE